MPRSSRAQSLVLSRKEQKPAVIASGRTLSPRQKVDPAKRYKQKSAEKWQEVVWEFYDSIGEYRYSVNWIANTISRATLIVVDQRTGKPVVDGPAAEALKALFGGPEYQKEMLRQLGIHFTTAGDCYVVGAAGIKDTDPDNWEVVAASELKQSAAGSWKNGDQDLGANALVIRLWRPHPRKNQKADSPSRAVLPILAEIDGLTRHVSATIDSRLASAGVLLVPSEITFSTTQTQQPKGDGTDDEEAQQTTQTSANDLAQEFIAVANEAIEDRESPAALTPVVIQAPGEYLKAIKFVTFSTPLDDKAKSLRDEAIRRLALGMDMPPEILTGTGDLSHWNAWSVEDAAIKAHAEPMLAILCSSLTESYMVDYLMGAGMSEADASNYVISADTTEMRLRPNRSKEAMELYDRKELSPAALRRENGFEDSDAPTEKEVLEMTTKKVAAGSPAPETVNWALREMGADIPEGPDTIRETDTVNQPENTTPSTKDHPAQDPPEQPADSTAAVIAAAGEVLIFRALERAGQRLRNASREAGRASAGIAARELYLHLPFDNTEIDELLDGAWDTLEVCSIDFPKQHLAAMLQRYTVRLLTQRQAFDTYTFRTYIQAELVLGPTLTTA